MNERCVLAIRDCGCTNSLLLLCSPCRYPDVVPPRQLAWVKTTAPPLELSRRTWLSPCLCVAVSKGMDITDLHQQHPTRCGGAPPVLSCLVTGLICKETMSLCPASLRVKHPQPEPPHPQAETGQLIGIFLRFYMRNFSIIL